MDKVSDKLAAMLASQSAEKRVRLNVMVKRGLPPSRLKSLSETIAGPQANESPEFLAASGVLSLESSLESVARIAGQPDVEWVDVEAVAPVEQLLD